MKIFLPIACFIIVGIMSCADSNNNSLEKNVNQEQDAKRIISLSGFLTEVLYELGHLDKIVGRDITSTYPKSIKDLPNLGHVNQLNAEALLALKPDMIFVEKQQLEKSDVLKQIQSTDIELVIIPSTKTFDNSVTAAHIISEKLETSPDKLQRIEDQIKSDSIELENFVSNQKDKPKVLFIYARGAGRLMVAGKNTAMASMIDKAGAKNAIDSFEGFRALTPEGLIEASPDVILMFDSGLESLDGKEGLAQITGMSQTPAYINDHIITMDGHYLSSFGTRVGQAAIELSRKIHQQPITTN